MSSFSKEELERAYTVSHRLFIDLVERRKIANIWSVGPGEKIRNGSPTGELSIIVGVQRKLPKFALSLFATELIPKTVEGFPTDVQKVGKIKATELVSRTRPFRPGPSWGNPCITAGTTGIMVRYQGTLFVDTNWHVGKYTCGSIGDAIIQPGKYDGGKTPDDKVGELAISLEDPSLGKGVYTDYALIKPTEQFNCKIALIDKEPGPFFEDYKPGDEIVWVGRTSGLGKASISQMHQDCQVDLGSGKTAYVYDTDIFRPPCKGGDSGSWVGLARDYSTVGKVFAGSDLLGVMIPARSIRKIYQGIEVVTDNPTPLPEIEYVELFDRMKGSSGWINCGRNSIADQNDGKYRWKGTINTVCTIESKADVMLKSGKLVSGDDNIRTFEVIESTPPPPPPPPEKDPYAVIESPEEGAKIEAGKEFMWTIKIMVEQQALKQTVKPV
jgi:hypothetical protein